MIKCQHHLFPFLFLLVIIGCASESVTNKRSKADIFYAHGTSCLTKKNYTEALSLLLKAEKLRPQDSKIHNNLGMAYFFKKKPSRAEFHLKRSIELEPKNSDAKNNLASMYTRIGRNQEAKKLYKQISKDLVYHHQYRVLYGLALIAIEENDMVSAIDYLNQSIDEKNDYCPAQFKLGEVSERQRNFTEAYKLYKKASLGTCVNQPAPHYQQAIALIKLRRYDEARSKLQEVIEMFSSSHYSQLALNKLNSIKNQGRLELTRGAILRNYEKRKHEIKPFNSMSF